MATTATQIETGAIHHPVKGLVLAGIRYDWIAAILSTFFTAGLFLDGWAHNHGKVDESFFTPWHAVFYSGFLLYGTFLVGTLLVNRSRGYAWLRSLPEGYTLSLIGAAIFAAGGVGDMVWHSLFGIEENIEALLSPTHLLLGLGMTLMVTGPLRAAWVRAGGEGNRLSWRTVEPMLLSMTMVLSIFTFLTQYAHPIVWLVGNEPSSVTDDSSIYLMNVDGSLQTRLINLPGKQLWSSAWSPDGKQVVFAASDQAGDVQKSILYISNSDGSGARELVSLPGETFSLSWSPDSKLIAFSIIKKDGSDIYLVGIDGSGLRPFANSPAGESWPDWSPDGTRLAYSIHSDSEAIMVANADGSGAEALAIPMKSNWGPAWSPDGSRIAFTSDVSGNSDIYTINLDGSGLTRITEDPAWDGRPDWSADGSRLVFTTWRNDNAELYTAKADGSDEHNLSNNAALETDAARWSPDGKQILFSARGHPRNQDGWLSQPLGVSSVLLQSLILMGFVLLAVLRWRLPFGSLALVLGINTLMMSFMNDTFFMIPAMVLAGLIGDILYVLLKPSEGRFRLYLFAFLVPASIYTLYFTAVAITSELTWTIHLWAGTIFLAGIVSLLLAILIAQSRSSQNYIQV